MVTSLSSGVALLNGYLSYLAPGLSGDIGYCNDLAIWAIWGYGAIW
jgi:hypothetical protein